MYSDVSEEVKSTVKQVYTEFYHQLVDAVSDPLTCQSLTAQIHPITLISQEKIAQLSAGQTSGSKFLKVLGVEEEPLLLTVLMEKMAGVKQLQKLAEQMTTRLSELQHGMTLQCVCVCVRACVHVCLCVHYHMYVVRSVSIIRSSWY